MRVTFLTWGMDAATTKVQWLAKSPSEVTPLANLWFQIWCIEPLPCVLVMRCYLLFQEFTPFQTFQAAAFWTMHWLQSSWLLNTDVEKDRRTVHLVWNSWWHIVGCCRCSMHVLWPPKQASGELRLNSSPRWRELPKPHVFDLSYIDSLLRFARKKKHNQILLQ